MTPALRKAVEERIAELAAKHGGRVTPEMVLKDAEDPSSPIHPLIPWDDAEAAHAYRLDICRTIIRSVKVEVETDKHTVSVVRYVRDPSADAREQGYVETLRLRDSKELAREAIRAEVMRVVAALERTKDLADVLGLTDEVTDLIERVSDLRRRVAA